MPGRNLSGKLYLLTISTSMLQDPSLQESIILQQLSKRYLMIEKIPGSTSMNLQDVAGEVFVCKWKMQARRRVRDQENN